MTQHSQQQGDRSSETGDRRSLEARGHGGFPNTGHFQDSAAVPVSQTFLLLEVEVGINQRWDESDVEVAFIQNLGAFAGFQKIKDVFRQSF